MLGQAFDCALQTVLARLGTDALGEVLDSFWRLIWFAVLYSGKLDIELRCSQLSKVLGPISSSIHLCDVSQGLCLEVLVASGVGRLC